MSTAVVDLAGQVALVTGGASGIGAGIARVLADAAVTRPERDLGSAGGAGRASAGAAGAVFLTSAAGATKERRRSEEGRQRLSSGPERASKHSILRQLDGERGWAQFLAGIPLGRPQSADDIGYACAYLASGAAANITGEALNVSGGQQMH